MKGAPPSPTGSMTAGGARPRHRKRGSEDARVKLLAARLSIILLINLPGLSQDFRHAYDGNHWRSWSGKRLLYDFLCIRRSG